MTTIGAVTPSLRNTDRAAWAQRVADRSDGRFTADQVLKEAAEFDQVKVQQAINDEKFLKGEGTYLGSSRGNKNFWDPAGYQKTLNSARDSRYEHYMNIKGPVTIEAIDVDSVVTAQGKLTGGDLKNLATYADYADHLRNEVAAATQVKSEVTFTGAWGSDRVTNDVNEYIGWLMEAAQQKSQGATVA